jgi:hypothetical protein
MSTWVEMAEAAREQYPKSGIPLTEGSSELTAGTAKICLPHLRGGEGIDSFAERLARARLLYARRREALYNWLALSAAMFIVLAAPSIQV